MQEYITEISKYLITMMMALYTFESFAVFRYKEEEKARGIYARQNFFMFFMQFLCYITLVLEKQNIEILFYYALVQIIILTIMKLTELIYERSNQLLVRNMCMLLSIGFVMLARLSFNRAIRQLVIVVISVALALLIPYLIAKCTFLRKLTMEYALVGIGALAAVLIVGEVTYGSKLSFAIAGFTFQPSEFVKIIFVFFLAGALCEEHSLKRVAVTAVLAGIHVLLLVLSKDLGSALIFFVIYVLMVFAATNDYRYLALGAVGGSISAVAAYYIFPHVQVRVQAYVDPWAYIDDKGYQITQSLFAISNGNWLGTGLGRGMPGSIPFVEEDFIFSAVCEELGVIFGICLILICISCFIMIMNIAIKFTDRFYRLIALGLGVEYIFQIFLTIGGGIKFIPLTGVTLPFVSYGGSSVLVSLILFYIIQGFYCMRPKEGDKTIVQEAGNTESIPAEEFPEIIYKDEF